MRFTVIWKPAAERHLAELWLDEQIRSDLTRAADELDRDLASRADEIGESRAGDQRIVVIPPLAAIVSVKPDDRIALVLAIWRVDDPAH